MKVVKNISLIMIVFFSGAYIYQYVLLPRVLPPILGDVLNYTNHRNYNPKIEEKYVCAKNLKKGKNIHRTIEAKDDLRLNRLIEKYIPVGMNIDEAKTYLKINRFKVHQQKKAVTSFCEDEIYDNQYIATGELIDGLISRRILIIYIGETSGKIESTRASIFVTGL